MPCPKFPDEYKAAIKAYNSAHARDPDFRPIRATFCWERIPWLNTHVFLPAKLTPYAEPNTDQARRSSRHRLSILDLMAPKRGDIESIISRIFSDVLDEKLVPIEDAIKRIEDQLNQVMFMHCTSYYNITLTYHHHTFRRMVSPAAATKNPTHAPSATRHPPKR
jgi:hypothetical protein